MINTSLTLTLPEPWKNKVFQSSVIGPVNFLVGPNGSGKSRFASALKAHLPNARLLNTDRLQGMESSAAIRNFTGDHFAHGFAKNQFPQFKNAGLQLGAGLDTFVVLEERLDLRIQVEATLSHLFNRKITLDWDSGNLVARAAIGLTGTSYRLDRDECHGIKELLVLLTHLYNQDHPYLIIDEPELNLHPQYQAFFMQEVRRVAGDPGADRSKKVVFLITHSPFILDFRTVEDVKSVISFDLKHDTPRHIFQLGAAETGRLATLVPRLNVHHKQLFFSDNPVFVEGIIDAQFVETVQDARGVSVAGAGSCVIDAGGCEEVNHYLDLCAAFGKRAFFLYDLDSLFRGNLRACIRSDGSIQSFLANVGVGRDFSKYCGELDSRLTPVIDRLISTAQAPAELGDLIAFLKQLGPRADWPAERYSRARVAVLTAISLFRSSMVSSTSPAEVEDIEGRLQQICAALRQRNVLLLPGGVLERYLPSFAGDYYKLTNEAKNSAIEAEMRILASGLTEEQMAARYGALFELICRLPSKTPVDVNAVLMDYLGGYIHDLQGAILNNPAWELGELRSYMAIRQRSTVKVFSLEHFHRGPGGSFRAIVRVTPMLGQGAHQVTVTEQTNAGMRNFQLEAVAA
jgi:hypothetical protein